MADIDDLKPSDTLPVFQGKAISVWGESLSAETEQRSIYVL